jgi:hypothetical protein
LWEWRRCMAGGPRASAYGQAPRNRGKNTTRPSALSAEGLQAPWTIEGAVDLLTFETYVRQVLAQTLKAGQIVILDNLAAHKSDSVRKASGSVWRSSALPPIVLARPHRDSRKRFPGSKRV